MSSANSTDPSNASAAVQTDGDSFEKRLAAADRLLERDPSAALRQSEALLLNRRDSRAFRLAAAAFRKLGRLEDSEAAELAGIKAGTVDEQLQKAAIAEAEGRPFEARRIALSFLRHSPDDLLAQTLAAEASASLWDLERAESMFRSILTRVPNFLRARIHLANCLSRQARLREAVEVLEGVIARKPNNLTALTKLAQLSTEFGDIERSVAAYRKLVTLNDKDPNRWVYLAQHYRIMGRADDAKAAFRRALSLDPHHGSAWWGLAAYFRSELSDEDVETIRRAVETREGTFDAGPLHIALGLVDDRRGNYRNAFDHFAKGKQVRLARQTYDPDVVSAEVDATVRAVTSGYVATHQGHGCLDSWPIFILGMQRSGSTLVERILGRHSQIESGGELPIMPRLQAYLRNRPDAAETSNHLDGTDDAQRSPRPLAALSGTELESLGRTYTERAQDYRRTDKLRFTDKLNLNWLHIGLIRLALPNAKIIDVRRGALDCCWANFKMLYAEGQPAANDLCHIGRLYRDYVRVVAAVDAAAPGGILRIRYEDVVDDIESNTRKMLDFLELEFEPDCIDFHLSKDAVATASSEQVRRPLNRDAIGAWKPYEPWLAPLIEALGPLARC